MKKPLHNSKPNQPRPLKIKAPDISQRNPHFNAATGELTMQCYYVDGTEKTLTIRLSKEEVSRFSACVNYEAASRLAGVFYKRFGRIPNPSPRRIVQDTLAAALGRPDLAQKHYKNKNKGLFNTSSKSEEAKPK
jgi:hypothetical protein